MTRAYKNKPLQNLHHMREQELAAAARKSKGMVVPELSDWLGSIRQMTDTIKGPTPEQLEAIFQDLRRHTRYSDVHIREALRSLTDGLDYAALEIRAMAASMGSVAIDERALLLRLHSPTGRTSSAAPQTMHIMKPRVFDSAAVQVISAEVAKNKCMLYIDPDRGAGIGEVQVNLPPPDDAPQDKPE